MHTILLRKINYRNCIIAKKSKVVKTTPDIVRKNRDRTREIRIELDRNRI